MQKIREFDERGRAMHGADGPEVEVEGGEQSGLGGRHPRRDSLGLGATARERSGARPGARKRGEVNR